MHKLGLLILLLIGLTGCIAPISVPETEFATPAPRNSAPSLHPTETVVAPSTNAATDAPTATCSTTNEEPGAVSALRTDYQISEELFLGWYCAGAGLGDIRKAYEVQAETGQPIEAIFAQFFAGVGWGEISQPVAQPAIDPEEQLCLTEHTGHREVMNIAEAFTQPAARIAGLFCRGMGFGEIRNALAVHTETDVPLAEIVTRFQRGQSWATIRAELNAAPLQGDATGND